MLTSQESKSISSLKVIFCFLIILLHTHYQMPDSITASDPAGGMFEIQKFVREFFSTFLCNVAIPGFAVISGYLFFATADFSKAAYKKKIQGRIYTLLIPYVVWNLIVLGGDVILSFCGKGNLVSNTEWSFLKVLDVFWGIKVGGAGTCPYNGPLWYIRDLFILCLFTPVIYPLLKNRFFKYVFGLFLFVVLFVNIPYVYYHERIFTVYFCIGCLLAVNQVSLFFCRGTFVGALLTICGAIAGALYLVGYFGIIEIPMKLVSLFFVFCTLFSLPSILYRRLQSERISGLVAGTFFVYCMHNSFLAMLGPLVRGHSSGMYLVYYLLLPILDFSFGYAMYLGVKKINNSVMNLLLLGKRTKTKG